MGQLDWQFLPVATFRGQLQVELPRTERQPRLVVGLTNDADFREGAEAMLPPSPFVGQTPTLDRPHLRCYRMALHPVAPPNPGMWEEARQGRLLYVPVDP